MGPNKVGEGSQSTKHNGLYWERSTLPALMVIRSCPWDLCLGGRRGPPQVRETEVVCWAHPSAAAWSLQGQLDSWHRRRWHCQESRVLARRGHNDEMLTWPHTSPIRNRGNILPLTWGLNNLGLPQPVLSQPHTLLTGNLDNFSLEVTQPHVSPPPTNLGKLLLFPLESRQSTPQAWVNSGHPSQTISTFNSQPSSFWSHHELGQLLTSHFQPAQPVALIPDTWTTSYVPFQCPANFVCPLTYQFLPLPYKNWTTSYNEQLHALLSQISIPCGLLLCQDQIISELSLKN